MDEEPQLPPVSKPSQIPSWVTLGFVLGVLFVLALPRRSQAPAPPAAQVVATPEPKKAAEAPKETTIEAVFTAWDKYAVWSDDTTEVAMWSAETKSFSEYYEVLRTPAGYYFRSLASLSRPVLSHGVAENSPLQFTETARQHQEWLEAVNKENWRAISEGARNAMAPPTPTPSPQ